MNNFRLASAYMLKSKLWILYKNISVLSKVVYNFNPWQENSPNLGVSHHHEMIRTVPTYIPVGNSPYPWCEPSPWGDQNRDYLHPSRELTQPWCEPLPWDDWNRCYLHPSGELIQPWCEPLSWDDYTCSLIIPFKVMINCALSAFARYHFYTFVQCSESVNHGNMLHPDQELNPGPPLMRLVR